MDDVKFSEGIIKLEYLSRKLKEIDIESRVLTTTDEVGLGTMIIALDNDYKGRDQMVNLTILPRPDDDMEHINLMQFYVELPETYTDASVVDIKDLIIDINSRMPIGHFGFNETQIYCRYVMILPDGDVLNEADIIETLFLFADVVGIFQKMIEDVCSNKMTLKDVQEKYLFY